MSAETQTSTSVKLKNHPRTLRQHLRLFFTGLAMGSVDIIPGVSGGTMAFILGIYEDLLDAIKSFNVTLIKLLAKLNLKAAFAHVPWQFLLPLGLGIAMAIFSLAHLISWLLANQTVFLFAFFFGLIVASIVAVGARIIWSTLTVVMLVVGTVVAFIVVQLVPLDMPHDPVTIFLSGVVSIMAMILPGISGSFLLVILGQYDYILNAVKGLDIVVLLPLILGQVVGITGFVRGLSWLLKHQSQATIAALVGFMVGSLWKIWPWKAVVETRVDRHGEVVPIVERNMLPDFATGGFWLALALCLLGFFLFCLLDHLQSRANPFFRLWLPGRGQTKP